MEHFVSLSTAVETSRCLFIIVPKPAAGDFAWKKSLLLPAENNISMDTKIKLHVEGIKSNHDSSGTYTLMLVEDNGMRGLSIVIGLPEAQAIAIAMKHVALPRPITPDLFVAFANVMGVKIKEVFISRFSDGVFYSEIVIERGDEVICLDSRTSDAVSVALRVGCDIYTTDEILEENNEEEELLDLPFGNEKSDDLVYNDHYLLKDIDDIKDEKELKEWLAELCDEELEVRLDEAIFDEEYENAKVYKDEIHRRKKKGGKK